MRATAGSIVVDLLMKTGMFETNADKAERRLRKLAKEIENLNKQTEKTNQSTNRTRNNQTNTPGGAGGGMLAGLGLGNLGRGAGIAGTIATYARLSDEATKLRGILMSSTSENIKYSQSLNDVTRIANLSQSGLEGVGIAYGRIALATADLGLQQREVADIVETVSLALKVNGATAAETQSVLIQLSQAFGKGKLDGDEFRTVMEAAPPVMRKLAESLGVPFGALKDMAAQGQITAEVLAKAWGDPAYLSQLRRQAQGMQTISGSITVARNSLVNLVASFDNLIPVSSLASKAIGGVANIIQFLADTVNRKPLDWKTFFNTDNIPVGMSVKLDPMTGKVITGTIADVNKQLNDQLNKNMPKNPNQIIGKNETIGNITNQLKNQSKELDGFLKDKTFQTASEKLQMDVDTLYSSFMSSVKSVPQDSPAYLEALQTFKTRYNELVNGTPKEKKVGKTGKSEAEKEQEAIQKFIDQLTKQNATLGKSEQDVLRYEASLLKLNNAQAGTVYGLIDTNEALSKQNEETEKAKQLIEEFQDPQKKFNEEYMMLNKLLKDGKISYDVYTRAVQDNLATLSDANPEIQKMKEELEQLNSVLEQTPTAKLKEQRDLVAQIYEKFDGNFSDPQFQEAIDVALGRTSEQAEKTGFDIEAAFKRAAENSQDALADFLFNPFKDGVDGMVEQFANALRRMVAEAAAAQIFKAIFGDMNSGDMFGGVFDGLLGPSSSGGGGAFGGFNFGGLLGGGGGFTPLPDFVPAYTGGDFGGGGFLSSIGDFFGGFFAEGGRPPMGKMSIVGEKGPELFVPDTAGTIFPQDKIGNNTNQSIINVDFKVNATDANSFRKSQGQIVSDMAKALSMSKRYS